MLTQELAVVIGMPKRGTDGVLADGRGVRFAIKGKVADSASI